MKAFHAAKKLDKITFTNDTRGWINIDGKNYWVVADRQPNGFGRLWLHASPSQDAMAFWEGTALVQGPEDADHEFALKLIRAHLAG